MNDLGLDLRIQGRSPAPVEMELVRDLQPADLALLSTDRGVKAPLLKRIRDSHHALARLIAMGYKDSEISAITGYSINRICILKGDPTMQELIGDKREELKGAAVEADVQGRLLTFALENLEEMRDRVNEGEAPIDMHELRENTKFALDRAGFGPQTKQTNVNLNVNLAGRLEAARKRVAVAPLALPPPLEEIIGLPDETPPGNSEEAA